MKLIEITENRYDVSIELEYAKKDNITGKEIYKHNRCFIHKDAEQKLLSAICLAKALGYKFKIFDAYRPTLAQEILWEFCPDKNFITASGWDFYQNEWWHYQLHNSKTWPLISNKAINLNIMGK